VVFTSCDLDLGPFYLKIQNENWHIGINVPLQWSANLIDSLALHCKGVFMPIFVLLHFSVVRLRVTSLYRIERQTGGKDTVRVIGRPHSKC